MCGLNGRSIVTQACAFDSLTGNETWAEAPHRQANEIGMQCFVALLRGINVGATRKLPMAELRALCLDLGMRQPETYIQSGNLIVDFEGDAGELRRLLERELSAKFGFTVDLIALIGTQWARYVTGNPFSGAVDMLPKAVHLYLSRDPMRPDAAELLSVRARIGERVVMANGALWIDYGAAGVKDSKLSPLAIDKACGSPATGRNWNSVLSIHQLIEARRIGGFH